MQRKGSTQNKAINLEEKSDSLGVTRNELYCTANLKCVILEISQVFICILCK